MKHNYQSVSKATGATLITFSILLIIFDSTLVWYDLYLAGHSYSSYFPIYTWTYGTGIICGILSLVAGSLGVSVSCNEALIDFFAKFGPTAVMGNVAGSIAIFFYGYISWCVAAHLYWMSWVASWNSTAFWASLIAVLICEWIFLTLIMALSFFQANFIGCTCCCRDPSEVGAIEPVGGMVDTQTFQQYPISGQVYPVAAEQGVPQNQSIPAQVYPTSQEQYPPTSQPTMAPTYEQPAQAPYGHYEANVAPQQVNESSFQ